MTSSKPEGVELKAVGTAVLNEKTKAFGECPLLRGPTFSDGGQKELFSFFG